MASGWLKKAQSAVFGQREVPPQPYVVRCECGMTYTGIRATKPQKTGCSRCGSTLFIFPVCPYPLPASVEIRWQGEELAPAKSKASEKAPLEKPGKGKKGAKGAAASAVPGTQRTSKTAELPEEPSLTWGERLRTIFTPLRLVMIGLAVTVGGTVAVAVRNARYEAARREVEPAIERGLKAFRAHDFPTASQELAAAVVALDRLGRTDAASRQVRQFEKEARAAAGLLTSPLSDTLEDILNEKSEESLATRAERRLAGQWLFLDASLLSSRGSESRTADAKLEVDAALMVGKLVCRIEFSHHPGKGWPPPQTDSQPQRTIFAAELETIRVGGGQVDAIIVLRGSTAVLWTSSEACAGLIPPPTDEEERKQWQALLERQQVALELAEPKTE